MNELEKNEKHQVNLWTDSLGTLLAYLPISLFCLSATMPIYRQVAVVVISAWIKCITVEFHCKKFTKENFV